MLGPLFVLRMARVRGLAALRLWQNDAIFLKGATGMLWHRLRGARVGEAFCKDAKKRGALTLEHGRFSWKVGSQRG